MPDEPEEIDWASLRAASTNLAEMIWSYHAALIACGFDENNALALTLEYQRLLMERSLTAS